MARKTKAEIESEDELMETGETETETGETDETDETDETGETGETEGGSIVPAKYRDRYRDGGDWCAQFITGNVCDAVMKTVKDPESGAESQVPTNKVNVDLEKLFMLAEKNGIPAADKYGDQVGRKNAPGRLRMTIGNMLRAAARHRHGLYDIEGNWEDAPAEFIGEHPKTQERDGTKIVVAKEQEAEAESEAA